MTGEETIIDAEHNSHRCAHISMRAATDLAPYDRIDYWIDLANKRPIKAKFYADSGDLLKTLYYRGYQIALGQARPTEAVILDGVRPSLVTTVDFGEPQFQSIPDSWFQQDFLPRFSSR